MVLGCPLLALFLLSAATGAIECTFTQAPGRFRSQISVAMRPLMELATHLLHVALSALNSILSASDNGELDRFQETLSDLQTSTSPVHRWVPGASPLTVYD